ncbi:MAG: hypothetical protein IPP47_08120 [Bryobacterales bacterium]|nr:hypothetical protein [Bryobacterales bacterium]
MATRGLLLILLTLPLIAADSAAALGSQLRQLALDPEACFRVRDLEIPREDANIHLTDGFLIFAKPVEGRRIAAVFSGNEAGDDAEILLRPPNRSERAALSASTGSPNLNEHFRSAVFIFSDGSGDTLLKQILSGVPKPNPEMGALLAGLTSDTVRNLCESFQVRLVLDLLANDPSDGVFYAAFSGATLGNFDLLHDATLPEQIILGQVSDQHVGGFNVWASFPSRSFRQSRRAVAVEDATMENYRIQAELQPDLTLNVSTRVTAKVRERLSGALAFELAPQMEVTSARVDGQPVEVFRRESMRSKLIGNRANDPFLIILPQPFLPGTSHEIEFQHSGKVIRPAGNNVYFVAARTNWYPTRGFHFSNFDLTFRVPKELSVVATGDIAEESIEGEWRISRRRTSAPVRMAGFNVGVYEHVDTTRAGFLVQVYANRSVEPGLQARSQQVLLPQPGPATRTSGVRRVGDIVSVTPAVPDPRIRLSALAAEITSSLEWMSSHFGPPPLRTLTASPIPGNFGQGFPGLLYLSTITFLSEKERPASLQTPTNFTFYSEILYAHETAHQWWGNLVTSGTYHDDWLQEALANYSALMILERRKGARALETALEEYRNELRLTLPESKTKTAESAGPITWGMRLHTLTGIDPWRLITYGKGSWIMHMLRRRMGDNAFLSMLGEIRKRYAYAPISTEQFREIAAEFSPKGLPDDDLVNFFDNWVYGTGVPTLELSSRIKGKSPNVDLEVTVRQSNAADEFSIDVPVEIRVPGQAKPIVQWLRTGPEPASVHVKLRVPPTKVELAPGAGVLAQRK